MDGKIKKALLKEVNAAITVAADNYLKFTSVPLDPTSIMATCLDQMHEHHRQKGYSVDQDERIQAASLWGKWKSLVELKKEITNG